MTFNQFITRIVRESDYSPASQLFCRVKKKMTGIYHKLDLVNIDAHTKFGLIMSIHLKILSGNEILTSIKGQNSIKMLRKMTGNNPKLDLVNDDVVGSAQYGRNCNFFQNSCFCINEFIIHKYITW